MVNKSYIKTLESIEKQHKEEYDKCLEKIDSYAKNGSFKAIIIFYAAMKESNIERLRQQGYKVSCSKNNINYCYTISWEKEVKQEPSVKKYLSSFYNILIQLLHSCIFSIY